MEKLPIMIHGNKRPTRCNRLFFIAKLIVRSTCFGHCYAHHQELKIYTDVCYVCYLALGSNHLYKFGSPDDGHNGARNMSSEQ